jgi:tetratricopeptide (TPR) repeat protein
MAHEAFGLRLTTDSAEAAGRLGTAIHHYLDYKADLGDLVKAALAAEPEFPMGNAMRGYLMMMFSSSATVPAAKKSLAAAEAHQDAAGEQERGHIAALRAWVAGDLAGANSAWEQVLEKHPRDLLALKLVTFSYFWMGDRINLRDAVVRVLPRWKDDTPGYGYLLGMLAFGHEECGEYGEAEAAGRRAVEIHPGDHWAAHAVAHVMEMQGRQRDGVAWLDGLKHTWAGCNDFINHLWWHKALFHLELEQYDEVLALYDGEIRRERSDFYICLQNAISLLWRLELRELDVGARWGELADIAADELDSAGLPFTTLHYVMALLADGREETARQILQAMEAYAAANTTTFAPVIGEVGLPVMEGLVAFGKGDYARAAERLLGIRDELYRTGGSHAQRDVIVQTLIAAHLGAGLHDRARELLAERTADKASSAHSWRLYAETLQTCGEMGEAQAARAKAEALLAG